MAKVQIKGLERIISKLKKFFEDDIATKNLLEQIGLFAKNRIQASTRAGRSLVTGRKLKPLSESYKDMRRGAVKFRTINGQKVPFAEPDERLNEVDSEFFDPTYSNLTFTGQLMRALRSVVSLSTRSVAVEVEDTKRRGKYEKLSNKDVAKHVADNGRPFLGLDKTGVARITAMVKAEIRKNLLKRGLKK